MVGMAEGEAQKLQDEKSFLDGVRVTPFLQHEKVAGGAANSWCGSISEVTPW